MLPVPSKGIARSITKHDFRLHVLCDWIEGSLLFQGDSMLLSQIDVADTLIDLERYVDQTFALQGAKQAWSELRRGCEWMGNRGAMRVNKRRLVRLGHWTDFSAQSFCVLLSLAPFYDWWNGEFGSDYTEQGEIFELLAKESFEAQFAHWTVYQTGWTRSNTQGFRQVVDEIINRLGEKKGNTELWNQPRAKERGLDLLCYREFPDGRIGIPVFLMQCASGENWDQKLSTPDLKIWRNVINFGNEPVKAFAMPFAVPRDEFTRSCVAVGGLLLDRYRILGASRYQENWLSSDLRERIIAWAEPRVKGLLEMSAL